MKLNKIILAIGLSAAAVGVATAASVTKKITLGATINDAIFVSGTDGKTWYDGTQDLDVLDGFKQTEFGKELPIRVYTTTNAFNISLQNKLVLTGSNGYSMTDTKVEIGDSTAASGLKELTTTAYQIKQKTAAAAAGAFDDTYKIKISAKAPASVASGASLNGVYTGDLALVFEPSVFTAP